MLLLSENVTSEHVMTKQYAMPTEPLTALYETVSADVFSQTVSDACHLKTSGIVISGLLPCPAERNARIRQTAARVKKNTVICQLRVNALFAETGQHQPREAMVIITAIQV